MPNDEPVLDVERRSKFFHRHLAGEILATLPFRPKDARGVLHAVVDMLKLKSPPPPASPKPQSDDTD
jgi:hypothetical protein